jgi:hypothetical protein
MRERHLALADVLFVVLVIVGLIVGGEPPDADEEVREIVGFHADNEDAVAIGAVLLGLGAIAFVFFGGYVRKVLRAAEGPGGVPSAVAFGEVILVAAGLTLDGTLSFALSAADDVDPRAVQALQALWDNDFPPTLAGIVIFLLATGISIARHAALPRWLGWAAIAIAVLGLTPVGFVAFPLGGLWAIAVSLLLSLRPPEPEGSPTAG